MIRERLLAFCAAVWGLAVAIALLPHWMRPAPPASFPDSRRPRASMLMPRFTSSPA
jgi:hypothetical protein